MTVRLADLTDRIDGVRKLGSVVAAMRGMAAARARQATTELAAVDTYAETIRGALARILAMLPNPGPGPGPDIPETLVVFLAEQGFAGAFSERVLDRLAMGARLVLVGTRGHYVAAERGIAAWRRVALPVHGPGVPRFADNLARELLAGGSRRIDAIFTVTGPGGVPRVETLRLFPIDTEPGARGAAPPVLNLPPADLLAGLMAEALHAGLCRAALHALASENAARMQAMAAAQTQAERKLADLIAQARQVRQETITDEIIELAAGEASFRAARKRADTVHRRHDLPPA